MTHDNDRDTIHRLNAAAPRIGAALSGIEAVAELLAAAQLDDETGPGSNATITARRHHALIGAVWALGEYAHGELSMVIGQHGADRLTWGTAYHLNGEHLHLEPDWWVKARAKG